MLFITLQLAHCASMHFSIQYFGLAHCAVFLTCFAHCAVAVHYITAGSLSFHAIRYTVLWACSLCSSPNLFYPLCWCSSIVIIAVSSTKTDCPVLVLSIQMSGCSSLHICLAHCAVAFLFIVFAHCADNKHQCPPPPETIYIYVHIQTTFFGNSEVKYSR